MRISLEVTGEISRDDALTPFRFETDLGLTGRSFIKQPCIDPRRVYLFVDLGS
jgi:hypothetical protein